MDTTLVLSDLHLGNGGQFDIFAGGDALPRMLAECARQPVRVICNGDTFDFLLNEDPLELDAERAVQQARLIVHHLPTAAVLCALGRVLAAGGEVIIRLGNHDIELALAEVQQAIREALSQPAEIAARLRFERGDAPMLLEVGGVRVLIAHGEHGDPWNRIDYDTLPASASQLRAAQSPFSYPPGSRLVKTLMNPLKRQHRMRFIDLLKPDFQGAVLTALAVNPAAVKTVFKGSTLSLLWQLFRRPSGAVSFDSEPEPELGLSEAISKAQLTEEEHAVLAQHLGDTGAVSFSADDASVIDSAMEKLGRTGLSFYAQAQRLLAAETGDTYFSLDPAQEEWQEARRLAQKFAASAVIVGHTHAARFAADDELTFVNTGTWIWLMQLPASSSTSEEWTAFLGTLRQNPALDPQAGQTARLLTRFHAALLRETPGGARLSLVRWDDRQGLVTERESELRAATAPDEK